MIDRRGFLGSLAGPILVYPLTAQNAGDAPEPLGEPHFPSHLHQFVWRNWEITNLDRMARVAGASPAQLAALGQSMGLPEKPRLTGDQLSRIYITVIRQNWHLLPNGQLIDLLGWDSEKFAFTLKEDDFLDHKLGPKPSCKQVTYRAPSEAEKARAGKIKEAVTRNLSGAGAGEEPPFRFIDRLTSPDVLRLRDPSARPAEGQVEISGWPVKTGNGVDAADARALERLLRKAIGPEAASGKGAIRLTLSPSGTASGSATTEAFQLEIEQNQIDLSGTSLAGLHQGVHFLLDQIEENSGPFLTPGKHERRAVVDPRYLYSFFALYGDPLLEPDLDPFPDHYLERLVRLGINGVWMQGVLSSLTQSKLFPEFGERSEERLVNLRKLAQRVRGHGMRLFLYLNEPRAQRPEFFRGRPGMRGSERMGFHAMCTSIPAVREWLTDGVAQVMEQAPELGGFFTITMSENLTNCYSKFRPESCPRCSKRSAAAVVGEVLEAIRAGVRRSSKTAELIHWDWGWREEMAEELIPKLTKDVRLQSVSEWSLPVERGGVKSVVGEYSISVVGPGPRAKKHWALARQAGVRTQGKTQFNNTWEISAVPYIPVPNLIARHCAGLREEDVSGLQVSWTLGGYPSPNLEVAKEFYFSPQPSEDEILARVARRRYGRKAAPGAVKAWTQFSRAFEEFPYGVSIYIIPTQHGPANLLRLEPSGIAASMLLFPQDDYKRWSRDYPPQVVASQLSKVSEQWQQGLPLLHEAFEQVPQARRQQAGEDLAVAETCYLHFRSVANQVNFYIARDGQRGSERTACLRTLIEDEIRLARRLYQIARRHSVIGYEATNHYYYRPLDLAEKIIQCEHLLGKLSA